jgi:hypothetical protein
MATQLAEKERAAEQADMEALRKLQSQDNRDMLARIAAKALVVDHIEVHSAKCRSAGEETIICNVPKSFVLTLETHDRIRFTSGIANVPKSLADHWYVRANGVAPLN